MLFSAEMVQAAKDDTVLYGWGGAEDPPFNYAVVGHDADTEALDARLTSSCCNCYQLIFEAPEPSSPQPPELTVPKPLIVQSFNTAAGGGKNFDVFMAAGGYGAFNACYNDPDFANTTDFGSFLYDAFPSESPGNGGIKFLNYEECRGSSWPVTVASVQSEACQSLIEGLCDQAVAVSGADITVTTSTRESCVRANQAESLYHQNWQVRAKRVECPESLTYVTGCRLEPQGLPAPDPAAQSPATADASFLTGYTTTTMQDCCKPTCAWTDWVGGQGLVADPEYSSFYSCDEFGRPLLAR
jgi:hypothetical protein